MSLKSISSKLGKLSYNFNPVLHNRIVLYFFFIISVIEIFYFVNVNDMASLAIFIIIGFLTTFFSKNMIVILCISLCITNVLKYGTSGSLNEGFGTEDDDDETSPTTSPTTTSTTSPNNSDVDNPITTKAQLKEEFNEFQDVQSKILGGIKEMDPLLKKAEGFIEKFEQYKNKEGLKGQPTKK